MSCMSLATYNPSAIVETPLGRTVQIIPVAMSGEDQEIKQHRDGQTFVNTDMLGTFKQVRKLSTLSFKINFKSLLR